MRDIPEEPWYICADLPVSSALRTIRPIEGIWKLFQTEGMEECMTALGVRPLTLKMVMKSDMVLTIYEDIDMQWKILQETCVKAKSIKGYMTKNYKMTANKFVLGEPKPQALDDWDTRLVVTTVTLEDEAGDGKEKLIMDQVAERDMVNRLNSQVVFEAVDDKLVMTTTVLTRNGSIQGKKIFKKFQVHVHSSSHLGESSDNSNLLAVMQKVTRSASGRKISLPY